LALYGLDAGAAGGVISFSRGLRGNICSRCAAMYTNEATITAHLFQVFRLQAIIDVHVGVVGAGVIFQRVLYELEAGNAGGVKRTGGPFHRCCAC